jgi:DNA-binding NtrC family response regulator
MTPYEETPRSLPCRESAWQETTTISQVRTPPTRKWAIEVGDGSGARRRVIREGESVEVGTSGACDLRLVDRAVSSKHCVMWVDGGRLRFADNQSRNGTFAGASRVQRGEVEPGASLVVGRTVLTCVPADDDDDDENASLAEERPLSGLVGTSLPMRRLARTVRRLAPLRAAVLIRGETGSGKELVARALHDEGPRRDQSFFALNMGALPTELADAELFGHERGAFTGAVSQRLGAFELARNGTLFLDEIAELALTMQSKLLRALEGGEIRAVGGGHSRHVDVRIIAATWAPLERRIYEGTFREDLFHRLAVLPIYLPPLRERKADIPLLVERFLSTSEAGPKVLSSGALSCLVNHSWPGNVRELRNVLVRAATAAEGPQITSAQIHESLTRGLLPSIPPPLPSGLRPRSTLNHSVHEQPTSRVSMPISQHDSYGPPSVAAQPSRGHRVDRTHQTTVANLPPPKERIAEIRSVLEANHGNISAASRELGLSRATIRTWGR